MTKPKKEKAKIVDMPGAQQEGTMTTIQPTDDVWTIKRLQKLHYAFEDLMDLKGEKFSYFVSRNLQLLDQWKKSFNKRAIALRPKTTERMQEYISKEQQIYQSFAVPVDGKLVNADGMWNIDQAKVDEMKAALAEFQKDFAPEMEVLQDYGKLLEAEENKPIPLSELTFYRINKTLIPEEMTARLRIPIEFLID